MPNIYIISGCNGAGKTTASYTVLPEILNCHEFVNADEIAKGLSPFNPEGMAIKAGRIMLARINELIKSRVDFAFETTLSTRSYIKLIKQAQQNGFFVSLIFFWLPSPDQAVQRVATRVAAGGHNIPEEVIRRRYKQGEHYLSALYKPICDYWVIYDNSSVEGIRKIAYGTKNETKEIFDLETYKILAKK